MASKLPDERIRMAFLVLAYPKISTKDYEWIQTIRQKHDQQFEIVKPHFTIVFPVFNVDPPSLLSHLQKQVSDFPAFDFTLRCTVIEKDAFKNITHVFLVPDEGYSNIVKLHDLLYTDILESELRLDISFIPHISIGNYTNPKDSKKLSDGLNKENFEIKGKINILDIVRFENNRIKTIIQTPLV